MVDEEPCDDCLNEAPDMIDSRWSLIAVPLWWLVTAVYILIEFFRRKRDA